MRTLLNPLKIGTVLDVYTHANEVRADVRTNEGNFYSGVTFMVQGGGIVRISTQRLKLSPVYSYFSLMVHKIFPT